MADGSLSAQERILAQPCRTQPEAHINRPGPNQVDGRNGGREVSRLCDSATPAQSIATPQAIGTLAGSLVKPPAHQQNGTAQTGHATTTPMPTKMDRTATKTTAVERDGIPLHIENLSVT